MCCGTLNPKHSPLTSLSGEQGFQLRQLGYSEFASIGSSGFQVVVTVTATGMGTDV